MGKMVKNKLSYTDFLHKETPWPPHRTPAAFHCKGSHFRATPLRSSPSRWHACRAAPVPPQCTSLDPKHRRTAV